MATLNSEITKKRKKKRIKWYCIYSLFAAGAAPEAAFILHQILSKEQRLQLSYLEALKNLMEVRQIQVFSMAILFLLLVFLLYISMTIHPVMANVQMQQITEDIRIPVPAGNGQHGAERFLDEQEKKRLFQVYSFSGNENLEGKGGLVIQMIKKRGKDIIYYISGELHSLIIGASGSGKTRRILLETIWLQLISRLSIVVSDVKGEIFYFTAPFAESLGYKTMAFDLRNPKKSVHYNFMQPILDAMKCGDTAKAIDYAWDLVSVLVGQQKGEPIWYNGECATIAAAILLVALDAPEEYRNLTNVYYFIAYMCEPDEYGEMPINNYLKKLEDSHPAKGVFAQAKIAPNKTRSSFFTSALGTLRLFTNPNIAEMTSKSDFSLKDIGKEKTILYLIIPDEKKTMYPLVSILVTQLYTLQVELANENGLRLPIDTDYDLDEVGNFPYIPILGNLASAGRSRGIRANLIIQDYQQLESKYKEEYKNIITNCQVKMYLKSDDPDTLKRVSENLGKYTVEVSSASTSVSDSRKTDANYSSSASLAGRALLEPAEVKRIKSPYAVCMITGEYAGINILPDLSEYRVNEIYGLGDEAFNTKLMMDRENARKEHDIPEIKLWGIWKSYQEVTMESIDIIDSHIKKGKPERISFI